MSRSEEELVITCKMRSYGSGGRTMACFAQGVCGTCETEVIDGDVDHRDSVLNEEEQASNEYMMVCVSRCRSPRLTLDL